MILLALAMLRARPVQALTVLLLATLAVGAAVAGPVYARAAQQAIVADDVARATLVETTISVFDQIRLIASPDDQLGQTQVQGSQQRNFETTGPALMHLDGFDTVFSVEYPAFFASRPFQKLDEGNGSLVYRENFCAHVRILTGRCVSGPGEAIVTGDLGFGVSATMLSTPVKLQVGGLGEPDFYYATAQPSTLVVVGTYVPLVAREPYWGLFQRSDKQTVLTDRSTLAGTVHQEETQTITAYPRPDTFSRRTIAEIRADVERIQTQAPQFRSLTQLDALLDRLDRDRATVTIVPGVAAVPLVALCWFVLFLAIAYTAQARRSELGMVKLRGLGAGGQWWIAAAESLGPVLVGAGLGYLLSHVAVWLYAQMTLGPGASVAVTAQPLPFALVALGGAIVAGLVALWRDLGSSATELLRRVPSPRHGWRGLTLAVMVCAVAGLAVYQLRSGSASGPDLARLAPALSIVGVGLLVAVLVDPVLGGIGRRALRRGRIGLALAGLHGGRRRSASRLLALIAVAMALLTFAATAAEVASSARRRQAEATVGADQVVTVTGASPVALLTAVRSVDPQGRYAMAVLPVSTGAVGNAGIPRRLLAVDSPRLPATARWPEGGISVEQAVRALRPPVADSVVIKGTGVEVDAGVVVNVTNEQEHRVNLILTVSQLDTGEVLRYTLAPPPPGRPYATSVACGRGCRLVDLRIRPFSPLRSGPVGATDVTVTFTEIRQTGPAAPLVSAAQLAKWNNRSQGSIIVEPSDAGVRAHVIFAQTTDGVPLAPPDTPAELAMVDAGGTNLLTLPLGGGERVTTTVAARTTSLPRLGSQGSFTDLEYLLRSGAPALVDLSGQVWLGPQAPRDVVQRLTDAGLQIVSTQRLDAELAASDRGPSAVGLRFLVIVAAFGLLLGAAGIVVAAGVERRGRAEELRALRTQGLRWGPTLRTTLIGYVGVTLAASAVGLGTAMIVWYATGAQLPLVDDLGAATPVLTPTPVLPGSAAYRWWAGGTVVVAVVAAVLAWALARSSRPVIRTGRPPARLAPDVLTGASPSASPGAEPPDRPVVHAGAHRAADRNVEGS